MKINDYEDINSSSGDSGYSGFFGNDPSGSVSLKNFSKKKKPPKKAVQNKKIFNLLVSTVLVISLIFTSVLGILIVYMGDLSYGDISDNASEMGITSEASNLPKDIINIALFGIDSRSKVTDDKSKSISGRSDAIIILSVNTINNTVKLTSILRDTWVPIEGHQSNKINAAYSLGGAQLAIKTINKQFGMNITDYVSVSLYQLWKVIDFMGGIDIHITEAELGQINGLANSEGFGIAKVSSSGYVHLNGGQAMSYARIRHIDGDNFRVLRQQKVLKCLFEKAKNMSIKEYPALLKNILANVETSLSYSEIMDFAPLLSSGKLSLTTTSIPGDTVVAEGGIFEDTRGGWVWKYDMDKAKKYLYNWIYDFE